MKKPIRMYSLFQTKSLYFGQFSHLEKYRLTKFDVFKSIRPGTKEILELTFFIFVTELLDEIRFWHSHEESFTIST